MRGYMDAVLDHPAFVAWKTEAFGEAWALPHYEEGETVVETFYTPDEARSV
jgi:glutathione S-transferase